MSWLSRLVNTFRTNRLDRDLDDEAQYHIEQTTAELIGTGVMPAEAERRARELFGRRLPFREASHDAKLIPWMESLVQDTHFGIRILLKERTVTAAAVLSLSLATGACTAAFSLIDALMLRPLPVPEPRALVGISFQRRPAFPGAPPRDDHFSYPFLEHAREAAGGEAELFGMTVWGPLQPVVFDEGTPEPGPAPEKLRIQWISGNGLAVLGVRPMLGRLLGDADDRPSDNLSPAVISYGFWMRRFGGSTSALGRTFTTKGTRFQIVGVTQKDFSGVEPGYLNDVWVPVVTYGSSRTLRDPGNERFAICGRLKPGVDPEQLRQTLQAAFTNFRREHVRELLQPGTSADQTARYVGTRLDVYSAAQGHQTFLRWQFERPLWILAAVVGLVLLIACSNVANLFVARAAARGREMAMRAALGGGRKRLLQQVLIESCLLALASSAMGLGLASAIAPSIVGLMSTSGDPTYLDVHPDGRVFVFLAFLSMLTTLLFGMAPALRATASKPLDALRGGDGRQSARIGVLRPVLVAQVAFSFVVLFVAGLLLTSFYRLTSVDLGFSQKNLLLFDMDLAGTVGAPGSGIGGQERARAVEFEMLDRLRHFPGVQGAATSWFALMGGAMAPTIGPPLRFAGRGLEQTRPQFLTVSPGFFATMQIPMLSGRDFTDHDSEPAVPSATIINQAFARQFFPNEEALGQRFQRMVDDDGHFGDLEVVGVVHDAKYNNLREPDAPTLYQPLRGAGSVVEVRTAGNPMSIAPALRKEMQAVDSLLRVTRVTLQSTHTGETILQERMLALLGGFFGLLAVVLSAVGLYGVLSYSMVQRTKEIGIRMALGAPLFQVVRTVAGDAAVAVAMGVTAGLAGGFASARFVTSILFEVKPSDFGSVALPLSFLLLASGLAAIRPALRATRVDPMTALRYE
jgi:putative ABC transport system permease protein